MSFIEELEKNTNKDAATANGAVSNTSTLDPLLDFFSKAGAMRGREKNAFLLFQKAFDADPQSAIRILFYLRDIRGGQGERSVFRYILSQLDDDFVNRIAKYIPEYGRWDEVPINSYTVENIIKKQLIADLRSLKDGGAVSLAGKWMPSEHSKKGPAAARNLARLLDWTGKPVEVVRSDGTVSLIPNLAPYRRNITKLRKAINLLEQQMSAREWDDIDYSKLPSQAHKKHVKAFYRHSEERYKAYLESVASGESKINSGTLFTYQLYDMAQRTEQEADAADALWANLPDYTRGRNAIVLPDVSGSMSGFPLSVSVSLAVYFAERNKGLFKDYFLEFSSAAKLRMLSGKTLSQKLRSVMNSTNWCGSTNLQSAFDALLDAAKKSNATQDVMPSTLYIISDMQFDSACRDNSDTNFEVAKKKYQEAGYELPHIVFWNANAWGNDSPAVKYDKNVTLVSGANQSAFQYAVEGKTPIEAMLDIINSDRYNSIII